VEADRSVAASELDAIDGEVSGLIERAVTDAKASAPPAPADLYSDVYINY
jgi:pyruvate dehydrogenase E1 component alpha subunit